MADFEFEAINAAGQPVKGIRSASDQNSLVQWLGQEGLRVQSLKLLARPAPASVAAPKPISKAPLPVTRTAGITEKDRWALFAQLGELLQSGIGAPEAMESLSRRSFPPRLKDQLKKMAAWVSEGRSMNEAFSAYPDDFPPGITGAIKSGEASGALPESMLLIAEQQSDAATLRRRVWWAVPILILAAVTAVLAFGFGPYLSGVIDASNRGEQDPYRVGVNGLIQFVRSPWTYLLTALIPLILVMKVWLSHARSRPFRLKASLAIPVLRKRVQDESLVHFTWHLSRLTQSGISPWTAWKLAAGAVPNELWGERLLKSGGNVNDHGQLSQIARRSGLLPAMQVDLLETGEMTGRIPQALDQAAEASRKDLERSRQALQFRLGCWAALVVIGGGMLLAGVFYNSYFSAIFRFAEP